MLLPLRKGIEMLKKTSSKLNKNKLMSKKTYWKT